MRQSQMALACAACGAALKVDESASQKAARLIYACRPCGKFFSSTERGERIIEERSVSDTGSRTLRIRPILKETHHAGGKTTGTMLVDLPAGMSLTLEVADGPMRGQAYRLDRRIVVMGREQAEITIPDPMISRRHASIEVVDFETIILRDLSSTNGTYHNDQLIAFCKIQDGDEIRIGSTTLTVSIDVPE